MLPFRCDIEDGQPGIAVLVTEYDDEGQPRAEAHLTPSQARSLFVRLPATVSALDAS